MQNFRSNISSSVSLFILPTLYYLFVLNCGLNLFTGFRLAQISSHIWSMMLVVYFVICYAYAGITNNDILLYDDRIEIINRVLFFRKKKVFQFKDIRFVQFRQEGIMGLKKYALPKLFDLLLKKIIAPLILPADYKWVKIRTDKEYRIFCFGIECDFYENESQPVFEDIFDRLKKNGMLVDWRK